MSKQKELEKAKDQIDQFDAQIKEMTLDRMNAAPKEEKEQQTQIAQVDKDKMKDIYLKPARSISSKEKFNEKFRDKYDFDKEYVNFTAENNEIIGETIDLWTKPYPGLPAEYWNVPTNKPIWAPRYLAERIKSCTYHRLIMQDRISTGVDGMGQYYGSMAVDKKVQRLDAHPESNRKSIFMGAVNF